MNNRCYLDYNASAPLEAEAWEALVANLAIFANPASTHKEGQKARSILEKARREIAAAINVSSASVIFTSGASEAAATLLNPHYKIGRTEIYCSHVYISAAEHKALLEGGSFEPANISILPLLSSGILDKEALAAKLAQHDHTKGMPLVAIQAANGETGVIQPIKILAEIVHSHKGLLIVDAVQYLGKIDMDISALDADFSIISAHKIGGPKNIGALICHSDIITPRPLIKGTQESGLRGGTQAIALCASFAAALKKRKAMIANTDYIINMQNLRDFFENGLEKLNANIKIHGKLAQRLCNTSFFSFANIDAQTVQIGLDLAGFAVSLGSACSSGRVKHSEVLAAMGADNDRGAIRISIGFETTKEDLSALLLSIKSFI